MNLLIYILLMALFRLISEISIVSTVAGYRTFTFNGVHEVRIRKSIHSLADCATITLPAFSHVAVQGKSAVNRVSTRTIFNDGDAISINLGYSQDNTYNGLHNEFMGFIKSRGLGIPMVMECEGYVRQLRQKVTVNKTFTGSNITTASHLLALATAGTDVTVECPVDFKISGVHLVNANGVQICDFIRQASDRALTIYFKDPKTIWCGIVYTPYADGSNPLSGYTINYRVGWNCLRDNGLKVREPKEPVQVKYNGLLANGTAVETASKNKAAANKLKSLLSHVGGDKATMSSFAQEKEYSINYTGYEGKLTGFLQPYCEPGMSIYLVDKQNSDMTGTYIIEGTEVTYGVRGARRMIDVGPKLGFGRE